MSATDSIALEKRNLLNQTDYELTLLLTLVRHGCELGEISLEQGDAEGLYVVLARVQENLRWAISHIDFLTETSRAATQAEAT